MTALTLERRQYVQDMEDQTTVKVAPLSHAIPEGFELVHQFGQEDARLWVPDQVLGAYGDALAGDSRAWDLLARQVQIERVNLA
ncbi:hypothetical protein [Actinomyces radicidentis]|uniref:hypothetical protein n=1 Tax=Actinomyces radicidentis TaxID=111015 RepID=UPI0012372BE3|nr:hypothetical protein [Actinomyces radicidentis]